MKSAINVRFERGTNGLLIIHEPKPLPSQPGTAAFYLNEVRPGARRQIQARRPHWVLRICQYFPLLDIICISVMVVATAIHVWERMQILAPKAIVRVLDTFCCATVLLLVICIVRLVLDAIFSGTFDQVVR